MTPDHKKKQLKIIAYPATRVKINRWILGRIYPGLLILHMIKLIIRLEMGKFAV